LNNRDIGVSHSYKTRRRMVQHHVVFITTRR